MCSVTSRLLPFFFCRRTPPSASADRIAAFSAGSSSSFSPFSSSSNSFSSCSAWISCSASCRASCRCRSTARFMNSILRLTPAPHTHWNTPRCSCSLSASISRSTASASSSSSSFVASSSLLASSPCIFARSFSPSRSCSLIASYPSRHAPPLRASSRRSFRRAAARA